jgi:hypothetical protein
MGFREKRAVKGFQIGFMGEGEDEQGEEEIEGAEITCSTPRHMDTF